MANSARTLCDGARLLRYPEGAYTIGRRRPGVSRLAWLLWLLSVPNETHEIALAGPGFLDPP